MGVLFGSCRGCGKAVYQEMLVAQQNEPQTCLAVTACATTVLVEVWPWPSLPERVADSGQLQGMDDI